MFFAVNTLSNKDSVDNQRNKGVKKKYNLIHLKKIGLKKIDKLLI